MIISSIIKKENFTKRGNRYDLILDAKTSQPTWAYLKALKPKGKYITVGGTAGKLILFGLTGGLISLLTQKKFQLFGPETQSRTGYHQPIICRRINQALDWWALCIRRNPPTHSIFWRRKAYG